MLLDFDELPWLIGVTVLVVILTILWRRKHSLSYIFCFSMFWVYLLLVLRETIFPIPLPGGIVEYMRTQTTFMSGVNFVPLYFGAYGPFFDAKQILLNIVLAVPFGFGASFVARFKARDFLWLAIAFGLGIETIQFVISLALGFTYRVIDVNDAILNAMGVLIGYGFFRAFIWWYLVMTQRLEIEHGGLSAYVYDIANRVVSN